jgi:two-component system response regulator HydG
MAATATKQRARILIVDDDDRETAELRSSLSPRFSCEVASSGETGLAAFGSNPFDVIVASTILTGMSALDLLDSVRQQRPDIAFILIGDDAGVSSAIEAGKRGAHDYILRPIDDGALGRSVDRAVAQLDARHQGVERLAKSLSGGSEPAIIGSSIRLAETLDAADRVAHSAAPVLLVGETGTGKDLLAQRIHARGPRRQRPFVVVNAGAIPATLLDSELFGHVAGAFTGATRARKGLVAEADGGTLFLDEIADLPIELQGRLLRVLESSAIRSVGADHERQVDVRFLAATQRDLSLAVRERTFREDLYFRLNVLAIHVPPLRDRREDLPALIAYFFDSARARNPRSPVEEISPAAYEELLRSTWPGNVRELQGFVERLVVLGKGRRIERADVELIGAPFDISESPLSSGSSPKSSGSSSSGSQELSSLRDVTTKHVETVLTSTGGDKARAAAILGIDVSTLYRWQRRRP